MKRSFLLTLLAPVVAAGSLHAASDMFLKLDGIKGESSDPQHAEFIEIDLNCIAYLMSKLEPGYSVDEPV